VYIETGNQPARGGVLRDLLTRGLQFWSAFALIFVVAGPTLSQPSQQVIPTVQTKATDSGKADTNQQHEGTKNSWTTSFTVGQEVKHVSTTEHSDNATEGRNAETGKWTNRFIAIFTLMLVVVGGLQVWVYVKQSKIMAEGLKVTAKAANAAKESADAYLTAERPWVSCAVSIDGSLYYDDKGDAIIPLQFTLKNIGHLPDLGIMVDFFIRVWCPGSEYSIIVLKEKANTAERIPPKPPIALISAERPIENAEIGYMLFPDEVLVLSFNIPAKRNEIERAIQHISPRKFFHPELCGLICYNYPLAKVRATTAFIYWIRHTGGLLDMDVPINKSSLRLVNHDLWNGFAT
jgi:hypothetical protein